MSDMKSDALNVFVNAMKSLLGQSTILNSQSLQSFQRIARSIQNVGRDANRIEIVEAAERLARSDESCVRDNAERLLEMLVATDRSESKENASILIIEDDSDISTLLQLALQKFTSSVIVAETGERAKQMIESENIDAVILDLMLPDMDGRSLLLYLREFHKTASLPIFVVSGLTGSQPETECIALGATAFIQKPFNPRMVVSAVLSEIRSQQAMERDARLDVTTGLPNRIAFFEEFERLTKSPYVSPDSSHAMALIDIDRFAKMTAELSQDHRDELVRKCAQLIQQGLRPSDFLARWRDEDFAVIFPEISSEKATSFLEKKLESFRNETIAEIGNCSYSFTFSSGMVAFKPGMVFDEIIAQCKHYLHLAKIQGKNRIVSEMQDGGSVKKKILLAEDDAITAALIKHRLEREGYDLQHYCDGESALSALLSDRYHLIILDVKMPVRDGFDVLTELRKIPVMENVPVIILTGMGSEQDIQHGFEIGANDYVLKPFSPVELISRIRRLLRASV